MMLSEATNRLRKNADKWYKVRDKLKDTKFAKEIDKDYEAIEILLGQTRLDFESWSYEELREFGDYIAKLKKEKYHTSETRKKLRIEQTKRYKEKNIEKFKESARKSQAKYRAKNREMLNERSRLYNQERRRKKRENEKVIALFG